MDDNETSRNLPEYAFDLLDAAQRLLLKLDSMSTADFVQGAEVPECQELRKVVEQITGTTEFMPPVSSEQYAARRGGFCPRCLSRSVFAGSTEPPEDGMAERYVRCQSCEAHWTELYELEGYRDLEV